MSAVSGMVFTIMGIWVAFLYPNAISRITGSDKLVVKDFSESRSDAKRLESIVAAILTSAFVMIAALMVILAKIIFFSTPIYLEYRVEFKALALTAVILMTFSQLESVLKVVVSNVMFINDLHVLRQDRQADRDI
ncbi:hypothetical protein [Methyloversatilis sp. NSM2]|uniref:hypothetical protein n=1 Tax=Methyloversatilis sp. NSM2 TaxID=3134135 RepID=UPI003113F9DB